MTKYQDTGATGAKPYTEMRSAKCSVAYKYDVAPPDGIPFFCEEYWVVPGTRGNRLPQALQALYHRRVCSQLVG